MRDLDWNELKYVSGAGDSPTAPCDCTCPTTTGKTKAKKGNNGFGNGSDAPNLAAPGGSGGSPGNKDYSLVR
jgi:hypothetical protein